MQVTILPIIIGAFGAVTKGLLEGTGGLGSWRTSGDHLNYCIIENGQNTESSPGRLGETWCHSNSSERPSAYADVKSSNE